MTRISEEGLNELARRFPTHLGEPKLSVLIQEAVHELRERRAADLTTADIDILRWLAGMVRDQSFNPTLWESSLVVIDRLLAQGERP